MLCKNKDDNIQQTLPAIPSRDSYTGGHKAYVGSEQDGDKWWRVRRPHSFGETNEADKDLLTFLSMNEVTV